MLTTVAHRKPNRICTVAHVPIPSTVPQSVPILQDASAATAPWLSDARLINKRARAVRAIPVQLRCWPRQAPVIIIGIPAATFNIKTDKPYPRGQCVCIAEARKGGKTAYR